MSDSEQSVDIHTTLSAKLPTPEHTTTMDSTSDSNTISSNLEREQRITAQSDLEQVKQILKTNFKGDPSLEDKSSFYPLQQKAQYMSPTVTLSAESKRIVRQAQAPILQASSRVVHFLYEVSSRNVFFLFSKEITLFSKQLLLLCIFI